MDGEMGQIAVELVGADRISRQRDRVLDAVARLAAASAAGQHGGVILWKGRLEARATTLANLWFRYQFGVDLEKVQVVEDAL